MSNGGGLPSSRQGFDDEKTATAVDILHHTRRVQHRAVSRPALQVQHEKKTHKHHRQTTSAAGKSHQQYGSRAGHIARVAALVGWVDEISAAKKKTVKKTKIASRANGQYISTDGIYAFRFSAFSSALREIRTLADGRKKKRHRFHGQRTNE